MLNAEGERLVLRVTTGESDDREAVSLMANGLWGSLYGWGDLRTFGFMPQARLKGGGNPCQ